jgi:DNA-binding transcriptional LysR family regulator
LRQKEILIIPVKGLPLVEQWRLIWHRQKKMSVVAKAFLDFIRLNKKQIHQQHFSWLEKY